MSEELSKEKLESTDKTGVTDLNNITEESASPTKPESDVSISTEADISPDSKEGVETSEKIANVVAKVIEQKFSGPIPPPNIIEGYENVVPGSADRIIRMAEQQSSHRQTLELMEVKAEIRDSLLGILFAFCLGIGCLIACVVTVIMVPAGAGAICGALLGATGIGSIVAAFLKNTRPSDK